MFRSFVDLIEKYLLSAPEPFCCELLAAREKKTESTSDDSETEQWQPMAGKS